MSEQHRAKLAHTVTEGVVTVGDVTVVRTLLAVDEDRQLAVVTVTTGGEPTGVRITESIAETHAVAFTGSHSAIDGDVTVEGTARPDAPLRFGYLLHGPVATAPPDPTVELLSEPVAEERVRATVRDGDDEETELAVRTETLFGQAQLRLPLLTLPDTPETDAGALDAPFRAMDAAAVGVVLTPTNEDAALRTVIRASQRGNTVLVTYTDQSDATELSKLSSLGAVVIDPPFRGATQSELNQRLSQEARERGLPGIVLQTRDCPRIDYERTADAFEQADYEVVAIPEKWSTTSRDPRVVIGIPAYNAATSIGEVVERVAAFADDVVVVDDGSADETAVRAREAGASVVVH